MRARVGVWIVVVKWFDAREKSSRAKNIYRGGGAAVSRSFHIHIRRRKAVCVVVGAYNVDRYVDVIFRVDVSFFKRLDGYKRRSVNNSCNASGCLFLK